MPSRRGVARMESFRDKMKERMQSRDAGRLIAFGFSAQAAPPDLRVLPIRMPPRGAAFARPASGKATSMTMA